MQRHAMDMCAGVDAGMRGRHAPQAAFWGRHVPQAAFWGRHVPQAAFQGRHVCIFMDMCTYVCMRVCVVIVGGCIAMQLQ